MHFYFYIKKNITLAIILKFILVFKYIFWKRKKNVDISSLNTTAVYTRHTQGVFHF